MDKTYAVRNPNASDFVINDLGQTVPGLSDIDLIDYFQVDDLDASADLEDAFTAVDLIRLDQVGGSPVPAGEEMGEMAGGQLDGVYPDPIVVGITETTGPTALTIAAIVDGEFLRRVGSTIVSAAGSGADPDAIHDNVAGEITAVVEKVSPVGADVLLIEDSAAGDVKKRVQITNLPGGADADAIHDNVAGEIAAVTEKATPITADLLLIEDSAAANAKKRVQLGNLPAVPWVEDEFTPTNGQITFILTQAPSDVTSLSLLVNGVLSDDIDDYTVSGTTLTWLNNLFVLDTGDKLLTRYV